jgi:hypothetical protein
MEGELTLLYRDVVAGEVTSVAEFRQRLETIESLHPDHEVLSVSRAVRAFSALESDAPSRHHQFELLQDALGIV